MHAQVCHQCRNALLQCLFQSQYRGCNFAVRAAAAASADVEEAEDVEDREEDEEGWGRITRGCTRRIRDNENNERQEKKGRGRERE